MVFKMHNGRLIRIRQKGLTGPLKVELLSRIPDKPEYWKVDKEVIVTQAEMRGFFLDKLADAE